MLSGVNEQVFKRRMSTKRPRERGSLNELGSSTHYASNFQSEISKRDKYQTIAKTAEAIY
jgi:hypothetical protein